MTKKKKNSNKKASKTGKKIGRPLEPDTKKLPLATKLSQPILEFLRDQDHNPDGIAPTIEKAVSKLPGYSAWFKANYEWVEK